MSTRKRVYVLQKSPSSLMALVLCATLMAGLFAPAARIGTSALGTPSMGVLFNSTFSDMTGITQHMGNATSMGIVSLPGGSGDGDLRSFEVEGSPTMQNRVSLTLSDTSVHDYVITLNATYLSGGTRPPGTTGGYAIFYRVSDWNTSTFKGYSFQFDPGLSQSFVIRRWLGTNEREILAQVRKTDVMGLDYVNTNPHEIVVKVIGNRHQVFVDGVPVFNVTHDEYLSGGIGLRTWNNTVAHFHDIKVEAVPTVAVTKTLAGFDVDIHGWSATNHYQIWTYQRIIGDILLDTTERKISQWVLSMPFSLGSEGTLLDGGGIRFSIDDFDSPTDTYAIAVRVADNDGVFITERRESYTPTAVGQVVIDRVFVDGSRTVGREFKEIKTESKVHFAVECNLTEDITYSASVTSGTSAWSLTASGNQFLWNTADLAPAEYTVEITATNGITTSTKTLLFRLFSVENIDYGEIDDMTVEAPNGALSITPEFRNGTFTYRLAEPGRSAAYTSPSPVPETSSGQAISHPGTLAPGVYRIVGLATRVGIISNLSSFDDGIARTVTVPRDGGGVSSMTLTADPNVHPEVAKGTPIVFTALADFGARTDIQYSFWRYDARGYVMIRDWSAANTLAWTPARVGIYTIEARAKLSDAGSYEALRNMSVNVTHEEETIAQATSITLNEAVLNAAQARRPVTIAANAASPVGDNLLYKFHVEDEYMGIYRVRDYSGHPHCVWTPRKPGTYTVHVLVKNEQSFGRYDYKETFEIAVSS